MIYNVRCQRKEKNKVLYLVMEKFWDVWNVQWDMGNHWVRQLINRRISSNFQNVCVGAGGDFFFCLLCISTFYYLLNLLKKFFSIFVLNIYTIDIIPINQILLIVPKNVLLNFWNHSNLMLKFFLTIAIFDLIKLFLPKIDYFINKKIQLLMDFIFEICLDSKFPVQGKILKKNVYHY